jgi:hypothetical protein
MLRHVTNSMPNSNEVWKESYKSIRKYYSNKIVIVDNNSDYSLINYDFNLENCEIYNNPHFQTRLFAPILYLLNIDFKKAVVLHDGCIFQKYVNFNEFKNVKYIWHFDTKLYDEIPVINMQLNSLSNNSNLYNILSNNNYTGCMGCCFSIEKSFLLNLENKYKISNLKYIINDQKQQIAFERTFSILCFAEYPDIINDLSYEGEIKDMVWGYNYKNFIDKTKIFYNGNHCIDITNKSIIKIFGARK